MSIDAFEHILKLKVKHIKKSGLYKIVKDVEYDLTMITQIFSDQCIECVFELAKNYWLLYWTLIDRLENDMFYCNSSTV